MLRSFHTRRWFICVLVAVLGTGAAAPGAWGQQPIEAGLDLFETLPPLPSNPPSFYDFLNDPIPADFFGPGSDPFVGQVQLQGVPLGGSTACPNDDLSRVDTIIDRLNTVPIGFPGPPAQIPIEIVELKLVSTQPITVTFNGGQNPEPWMLEIDLSGVPHPQGILDVTATSPDGGTFDTFVPIFPRLTFTRVSDLQQVILDKGLLNQPVELQSAGDPWQYQAPLPGSCTSNFCPGFKNNVILQSPQLTLPLTPICPGMSESVPASSRWSLALTAGLLAAMGAALVLRRRVVSS